MSKTKIVKNIFGINLRMMRFVGFYPPRKYKHWYKIYSCTVYCMLTTLIPILSAFSLIMDPDVNLDKVSDNAFMMCQMSCFIIKMWPFLVNEQEVKKSIYMMEHPVFVSFTQKQETIVTNCKKTCQRTSLLFLNSCVLSVITWGIIPYFEKDYKLPIDIWLPYDYKKNSKLYIITFFYVFAGGANGAISNGALDPLIAGMTYFATCQLKILKDNLQHLGAQSKLKTQSGGKMVTLANSEEDSIYDQIKHCVYHHNIIIEFVENFEKIYSSVAFAQFSASVLVICICCFRLTQLPPFSIGFLWMAMFLCIMLAEIFLYCFYGTTLFEENNTLIQAVYMGRWYEYDLKSKKALLILMERSRRPMVVTAGKILDLSLETFITILKRAYSLCAVLKNY